LRLLCALAVLLLVGCHQQDRSPKATAHAADKTSPVARPKPINKAVLDAEGVTFDSPAGKTREFDFGADRPEVEALAQRMFGAPDEQTANDECGAGPMEFSRYGPLTLNFQDGKLAGWLAREGPQVVTSDGIHPGTLMRDLKVARSAGRGIRLHRRRRPYDWRLRQGRGT